MDYPDEMAEVSISAVSGEDFFSCIVYKTENWKVRLLHFLNKMDHEGSSISITDNFDSPDEVHLHGEDVYKFFEGVTVPSDWK